MTSGRIVLVNVLIAVLIAGSAYAVVTDKERWPFSPYPMYSYIDKKRSVKRYELLGVTNERKPRETRLVIMKQLHPWDDARLMKSLRRIVKRRYATGQLKTVLGELLRQYENRRLKHLHSGPALKGFRLYRLQWNAIGPDAFNPEIPDERELIIEVRHSTARGGV